MVETSLTGDPERRGHAGPAALERVLNRARAELGYTSSGWTVGLLERHLEAQETVRASDSTIRRVLHAAGYRWKRPRFVLARRDPERERKSRGTPDARAGPA